MRNAPAATELRTIRVYGTLAKVIGCRTLRAAVSSVPEAMRFLMANFPQVEGHLKGRFFKVKVSSWDLTEDELKAPIGRTEDVHIIPAICGAGGNNPLTGILAGTALIGIGLLIPFTGPLLIPLGLGLVLNGVAGMLSPTPEVEEKENDPSRSYNFSGIQQTASEGIPVPLVYGDIFTGSVVLSVGIEEDDEDDVEGVGGGAAGGTFNSGTGNPNPNPNPVPGPEEPVYIGPISSPTTNVRYDVVIGKRTFNPHTYLCGGGSSSPSSTTYTGGYLRLPAPGGAVGSTSFYGRGLRVKYLETDKPTKKLTCGDGPGNLYTTEFGAIEVLDFLPAPGGSVTTGWSVPYMVGTHGNPFRTEAGLQVNTYVYQESYLLVSSYIGYVQINGVAISIPDSVSSARFL
jgi:predicted phage tail protein